MHNTNDINKYIWLHKRNVDSVLCGQSVTRTQKIEDTDIMDILYE